MNARRYLPCLLLALALLPSGQVRAGDTHVDARDYPGPGQGADRFHALETTLVRGFDNICGDTFCEGEYGNLQALRYRCSVNAATGGVHACVWSFAGSTARVDAATGALVVDARTWACPSPLAANTPLALLLDTLQGDNAIHIALPGSAASVYDALTECL